MLLQRSKINEFHLSLAKCQQTLVKELKEIQPKFYVAKPAIGEYRLEIQPLNNYEEDIKRYQEIYGY